jgi:hypothetical protein
MWRRPNDAASLHSVLHSTGKQEKRMSFDLNKEWSDADVASLLASVEDDRDWRLEVDKDGIVSLQDKSSHPNDVAYDEGLYCYFETWHQGTDFVGPSAASDKQLVASIAKALRNNHPALVKGPFIFI